MSSIEQQLKQFSGTELEARLVGLPSVLLGRGTRERVFDEIHRLRARRIAYLVDGTPMTSPDGDLKWQVRQMLEKHFQVDDVELPASVHADEVAVESAIKGCAAADVVVTVGSGTIVDIGKVAAGDRPHVALQTAASVNGYADDQSVLLKSGVKRTVHSAYPESLIIDSEVLALAPVELNRSGLGDMISMFTAHADWYLAHHLGMDDNWLPAAAAFTHDHSERMLEAATLVGQNDPGALEFLAELLTLSGVSMGLAGQTAPSSGTEHLLSHMLDMWAGGHGQPTALHGSQVGVTTVVAAVLWERMFAAFDAGEVGAIALLEPAEAQAAIESAFKEVDPSGGAARECWADYAGKLERMVAHLPARLEEFCERWEDTHRAALTELLVPAARIVQALRDAGAPTTLEELEHGNATVLPWALEHSHLMRKRFTMVDLAFASGRLGASDVEGIIEEANALGSRPPRIEVQG